MQVRRRSESFGGAARNQRPERGEQQGGSDQLLLLQRRFRFSCCAFARQRAANEEALPRESPRGPPVTTLTGERIVAGAHESFQEGLLEMFEFSEVGRRRLVRPCVRTPWRARLKSGFHSASRPIPPSSQRRIRRGSLRSLWAIEMKGPCNSLCLKANGCGPFPREAVSGTDRRARRRSPHRGHPRGICETSEVRFR